MLAQRLFARSEKVLALSFSQKLSAIVNPVNQSNSKKFHVSQSPQFVVGRRRRPSGTSTSQSPGNLGADGAKSEKDKGSKELVRDPSTFVAEGMALLNKIMKALRPLEEINNPFLLTMSVDEDEKNFISLDLGALHGQYIIKLDTKQQVLIFTSPISGRLTYNLETNGDWSNVQDRHNFEGLLVRDLIRQIKGVPKL